jgi:hypothetical protein
MLSLIHTFFQEVNNIDIGNNFLKKNKSFIYHHIDEIKQVKYSNIQSRKIIYSLLLYKFPNELNCPNNLYQKSREFILNILNNNTISIKFINEYITLFDEWKKKDLEDFMLDIASSYINLQETRKTVIDDPEWIKHIDDFSNKLLTSGKKLNEKKFLEILNTLSIKLDNNKKNMIQNVMEQVYWDKFKNLLEQNDYSMLYQNFNEIKDILDEIKQDENVNEIMDIDFLKQIIHSNVFNEKYLINYINFIVDKLLSYGIPIYDKLIKKTKEKLINDILENSLTPLSITNTYKSLMDLLVKLIKIIRIYRNVYNK